MKITSEEFYRVVDESIGKAIALELKRQPLKEEAMRIRERMRKSFERLRADGYM